MKTICKRCRRSYPAYYLNRNNLCICCESIDLIPNLSDYRRRENYVFDAAYGHQNATKHPRTGVDLLDSGTPRLSQIQDIQPFKTTGHLVIQGKRRNKINLETSYIIEALNNLTQRQFAKKLSVSQMTISRILKRALKMQAGIINHKAIKVESSGLDWNEIENSIVAVI